MLVAVRIYYVAAVRILCSCGVDTLLLLLGSCVLTVSVPSLSFEYCVVAVEVLCYCCLGTSVLPLGYCCAVAVGILFCYYIVVGILYCCR